METVYKNLFAYFFSWEKSAILFYTVFMGKTFLQKANTHYAVYKDPGWNDAICISSTQDTRPELMSTLGKNGLHLGTNIGVFKSKIRDFHTNAKH